MFKLHLLGLILRSIFNLLFICIAVSTSQTAWAVLATPAHSSASDSPEVQKNFYRELSLKVRTQGNFQIRMPSNGDLRFSYQLQLGAAVFNDPIIRDYPLDPKQNRVLRVFYDKIFLEDGSSLELSGEKVPLTCLFIRGQDNRLAKNNPLLPDILLQVYLVANDYSCTGPINPGWPENGGRKESWDTYLRFDVRDPTIMLPVETLLRYRWNEYSAVLIDSGNVNEGGIIR